MAKMKRILAGAAGLMAISNAVNPAVLAAEAAQTADTSGYSVSPAEEKVYDAVENVQGSFRFDQSVVSPSDNVFSLFGTAATGACAAPDFVFEDNEDKFVDYYLNVGGKLQKAFRVPLSEMVEQGKTDILKCSCAMSPSIVNVEVTGIPLANIVEMAELEDDIKTVTVKGSDGYGISLSIEKAIEKNAMLVYKVGGEGLKPENGGPVQLWMPGAAANYFTRQVTDIEFSAEPETDVAQPSQDQRAKVSIMNSFEDATFESGSQITFEGYADDFDVAISAVEFSMDGGNTWTSYETQDVSTNKWVYWYFTYEAAEPGAYRLDVRSRTADGKVSPMASSIEFNVV
ncbi:MAG: molybdopterin-dependent oxidoreductase [Clostridia bacterium]|nr:molybdopterin-dependent oxidoreductase [Clostridia bacterium]